MDHQCPATTDGHRYIVVGNGTTLAFRMACERCGHVIVRRMST